MARDAASALLAALIRVLLPLLDAATKRVITDAIERIENYGVGVPIAEIAYWIVRQGAEDRANVGISREKLSEKAFDAIKISQPALDDETIVRLIEVARLRLQTEALSSST